ncbi:hypothetical protein K2173_012382 [Erythroxylum novogranatense]|uniref:NB-ARC domain-containing protein n=1 Tax=Erythroxylum novogranatense TaxID=1862640 RepID=A0AAV8UCL8_9ROSI|nr:hypothetical protein K2173_012382 [Erythroxylum novogranatense]
MEPEDLELDQLQKFLRKELDRKKYVIVLDDVWNEDPLKWLAVKDLLMCGARGSRVLVTTRSKMVAELTGTLAQFNLEGLSPLQSWSLFIRLWIAQGFISPSSPIHNLEAIKLEYFKDLFCKMHDLMHDLATLKAEAEIIQSNLKGTTFNKRHVMFHLTLIWIHQIKFGELGSNYEVMFLNFRYLRVFDLHSTGIVAELSSINHLKHLRYLDLSNNVGIQVLPHIITDLVNLQVLKLSFCRALKELPKDIEKLLNLRHLYCDGCDKLIHMPSGIGNLMSLQSLSKFATDEGDTTKASTTARVPHFPCLSTLRINRCPELTWMPIFPSLDDRLSLENATVKPFQLTMEMKVAIPVIASSVIYPLSKLKALEFRRIGDLESLPGEWIQNLTSLKKLYIGCCPRLTSLAQGMHHLTSLRELTINFCPEVKEKCENKKGVDWSSIAHIPNITIDREEVQIESLSNL